MSVGIKPSVRLSLPALPRADVVECSWGVTPDRLGQRVDWNGIEHEHLGTFQVRAQPIRYDLESEITSLNPWGDELIQDRNTPRTTMIFLASRGGWKRDRQWSYNVTDSSSSACFVHRRHRSVDGRRELCSNSYLRPAHPIRPAVTRLFACRDRSAPQQDGARSLSDVESNRA